MINRLQSLLSGERPHLYAVLDIGTVEAKALVVLVENEQAAIVGVGREAHAQGAVQDGGIANTEALAAACEKALANAEALTETVMGEQLVADRAVLGISGPVLKSTYVSLAAPRARPADRITEGELRALLQRAERLALQQARSELAMETGSPAVDVGLVDADVVQILVDGYRVSSPVRLQGRQLEVRVFNLFAPLDFLAAVNSVAAALELEPVMILAGPCLVGRVLARGDAIVIDIGGECTDVVLLRGGGIERMRTLPMGGLSFTRRVGRTLGVPVMAAEEIKKSYAAGRLDWARTEEVRAALTADVRTWLDAVQALLEEMAASDTLPPRVLLCGGGAALPDLERAARSYPWVRLLPFTRYPEIIVLQPSHMTGASDRTRRLVGESFVVPAALAAWTVRSLHSQGGDLPQQSLQRVLHGMRLS